jgi:hypothetical protein
MSRQVTLSGRHRRITFVVSRRQRERDVRTPEFLSEIARQPGVLRLEWQALA